MSPVTVYIEDGENGSRHAHLAELPGVNAVAESRDLAVARCLEVLQEESLLASQAGLPVPSIDTGEVIVVDLEGDDFLPGDEAPLGAAEVAAQLPRMENLRRRLLGAVEGLTPTEMDQSGGGAWSVNEVLFHVMEAEEWYRTLLDDPGPQGLPAATAAVERIVAELRAQTAPALSRAWPSSRPVWSVRRVLAAAIERQAAWGGYALALARDLTPGTLPVPRDLTQDVKDAELAPITPAEVEAGIAILSGFHRQLVQALAPLSEEDLQRRHGDAPTLISAVSRAASALRNICDELRPRPADVIAALGESRAAMVARLSALSDEERAVVHQFPHGRWSARKVMRRTLEHEREHLDHLRALLAAQVTV
ncbi:MAG: hypothetical protein ACYDAY_10850 [Candidatus Dormibacteria bacterium]